MATTRGSNISERSTEKHLTSMTHKKAMTSRGRDGWQPQGRRPWGWLDRGEAILALSSRSFYARAGRPRHENAIPKLRLRLPPSDYGAFQE